MDDAQPLAAPLPGVDDDLIDARAAAVDPIAFEAIYLRHRLAVYRYARSRTQSDDAALDVAAQTFERALNAISTFRPRGGGMAAWLLRIARNVIIDDARRTAREARPLEPGSLVRQTEPTIADDDAADLRALVAGLPERQREALALRYAAGLTANEIGEVLGVSGRAAQKQLERALVTLREAYRDE